MTLKPLLTAIAIMASLACATPARAQLAISLADHPLAPFIRGQQSLAPEFAPAFRRGFRFGIIGFGNHAQRDFGFGPEQRPRDKAIAFVYDTRDRAAVGDVRRFDDIAAKNPQMPGANALLAFRSNDCCSANLTLIHNR